MPPELTLTVVDQSPVRSDGTAAEALWDTVKLAMAAESFGYARYWVTEHHNSPGLAGTAPEMLIGQIAARTSRIRVGSAGVMLSHYSALKVAEQFRILECFYPGRIDLGVGRAPGSDPLTAAALAYPKPPMDIKHFPQQVRDLIGYLADAMDPRHPFASIRPGPGNWSMPDIWLLGSSDYSAQLAARLGLPFAYAHFFGRGVEDNGPAIAEMYRRQFQPSEYLERPRVNVTLQVICAETEEEALRLASSRNLSKLLSALGQRSGLLPVEEALAYPYNAEELAYIRQIGKGYIDGDPQQVKEKIVQAAEAYQTADIGIVTACYDFAKRVRSYELIAEAFGLKGQHPEDAPPPRVLNVAGADGTASR